MEIPLNILIWNKNKTSTTAHSSINQTKDDNAFFLAYLDPDMLRELMKAFRNMGIREKNLKSVLKKFQIQE